MAITTQYVVSHKGVEKLVTTDKKAADQYDKMLDVADNLAAQLNGGDVRWERSVPRFSTSTLASSGKGGPTPEAPPLSYPAWLEGEWNTKYVFTKAQFPQGRGILSLRVPGAGLATCLAIPNVGKSPFPFRQRYLPSRGGGTCYPDLAYNYPRLLEAFWSEAHTSYVQVGASSKCMDTGDGCDGPELHAPSCTFTLCFSGPSRAGPRVEQRAESVVFRAESAMRAGGDSPSFLTREDVVQNNVEQHHFTKSPYVERCGGVGGREAGGG